MDREEFRENFQHTTSDNFMSSEKELEENIMRIIGQLNESMDSSEFQNFIVNSKYNLTPEQQEFFENNPETNLQFLDANLAKDPLYEESQRYTKSIFFPLYRERIYQLNFFDRQVKIFVIQPFLREEVQRFMAFQNLYKKIVLEGNNSGDAIFKFEQEYSTRFSDTCEDYVNFLDDRGMYLETDDSQITLKISNTGKASHVIKLEENNFFRTSEFVNSMCKLAIQNTSINLLSIEGIQSKTTRPQ